MAAVDFEQALSIGLVWRTAGDAVSYVTGGFAGFFVNRDSFDGKGLADMREVEIVVEFGGGPDLTSFDAAVIGRVVFDEQRLFAIVKEQDQIIEERGLIGFDGEVVVGVTFTDQVVGYRALG
jgi:hypothetical protein